MVDLVPVVSIAAGVACGRLVKLEAPQLRPLGWITNFVFHALLVAQGAMLEQGLSDRASALKALGAVVAGLLVVLVTVSLGLVIEWREPRPLGKRAEAKDLMTMAMMSLRVLACLALGMAVSRLRLLDISPPTVSYILYVMLFLVGVGLFTADFRYAVRSAFKKGCVAALIAILGSALGGACASILFGRTALLASLGCGWYSYAGPFLTISCGVDSGLSGLFLNLTRECVALLFTPFLAPVVGSRTLSAVCGAGAMDSLLPVIARCSRRDVVTVSIVSGLMVTIAVPPMLALGAALCNP